ncbi:MAG: DNA cytosine methyltransferase [Lachnospiraceae bacterium]|nr:DNA cytosine methyltransferase [Lachnospiraceae bacterium]
MTINEIKEAVAYFDSQVGHYYLDSHTVRKIKEETEETEQRLEPNLNGKTNTITTVQKDNHVLLGNLSGGKWDKTHEANRRVYSENGKMQTIQTMQGGNQHPKTMQYDRIRRLTPTECARLQTIPEWYQWIVSETQQ